MWYMHEGMNWWMLLGGFWMLIFWGGLIALVVWGFKSITGGRARHITTTPLDIARERYARGEISRQEFEQLRSDLERKA